MKRREINALPLEGDVSFRERTPEPGTTALLIIDLQKGEYNETKIKSEPQHAYFWDRLAKTVIPNGQKLLTACRAASIEILFTNVECYTLDGRDRSLDYKISGIFAAKGSKDAEVIDELKPLPNEIFIPKMSSSVFMSTNIEYVLHNLGIEYLMVMGVVTDQCVESAVRDACDLGFLVTLIDDASATMTQERQDATLRAIKGYCRQRKTEQVIAEIRGWHKEAAE
jgi:ureidoacrylate peracid hydrolase